jgi:hypothetical protein
VNVGSSVGIGVSGVSGKMTPSSFRSESVNSCLPQIASAKIAPPRATNSFRPARSAGVSSNAERPWNVRKLLAKSDGEASDASCGSAMSFRTAASKSPPLRDRRASLASLA